MLTYYVTDFVNLIVELLKNSAFTVVVDLNIA